MKTKGTLIGVIIFIALFGFLKFIGYLKIREMSNGPDRIGAVVIAYQAKFKQWPPNPQEFQKFVENSKEFNKFDLNAYQGLKVTEAANNKVLTIRYEGYKKGNISTGPNQMDISFQPSKK